MAVGDDTARSLVAEIATLGRLVKGLSQRQPGPLTPAQQGVLHLLTQRGECRQHELSSDLGVGPSALSRQVGELVALGLVDRRPDPEDGRAALISTSPDGAAALQEVADRRSEALVGLLAGWDEDEARAALSSVERLVAAFSTPPGRRSPTAPDSHSPEVVHL